MTHLKFAVSWSTIWGPVHESTYSKYLEIASDLYNQYDYDDYMVFLNEGNTILISAYSPLNSTNSSYPAIMVQTTNSDSAVSGDNWLIYDEGGGLPNESTSSSSNVTFVALFTDTYRIRIKKQTTDPASWPQPYVLYINKYHPYWNFAPQTFNPND